MDAKVGKSSDAPQLAPLELKPDGTLPYAVFFHSEDDRGQMGQLTPQQCLEVWQRGDHRHQRKGTPKPDYLHTPEQLQAHLDWEAGHAAKDPHLGEKRQQAYRFLTRAAMNAGGVRIEEDEEPEVADYLDNSADSEVLSEPEGFDEEEEDLEFPDAIPEGEEPEEQDMAVTTDVRSQDFSAVIAEYQKAAALLGQQGKEVTVAAVADLLSVPTATAAAFIKEHPECLEPGSEEDDSEESGEGKEDATDAVKFDRAAHMRAAREARGKVSAHGSYLKDFPPVEETAAKMAALSTEHLGLLRASLSEDWGVEFKKKYAAEHGMGVLTLGRTLSGILEALGFERKPALTKYLRRCLKHCDRHPELAPKPAPSQEPAPVQAEAHHSAAGNGADPTPPLAPEPPKAEALVPVPAHKGNGAVAPRAERGVAMPRAEGVNVTGTVMVLPPGVKRVVIEFE